MLQGKPSSSAPSSVSAGQRCVHMWQRNHAGGSREKAASWARRRVQQRQRALLYAARKALLGTGCCMRLLLPQRLPGSRLGSVNVV
jgi:hypothetical protein